MTPERAREIESEPTFIAMARKALEHYRQVEWMRGNYVEADALSDMLDLPRPSDHEKADSKK